MRCYEKPADIGGFSAFRLASMPPLSIDLIRLISELPEYETLISGWIARNDSV